MKEPRKQHWDEIYACKGVDAVSWYQAEPTESLRLIRATGIGLDEPIIDVGGGASILIERLLDSGFSRAAVLDLSGRALAASRARLGPRARQVEWHETDVTAFDPPHQYSLWHDRAVFHFLTDAADRRRYKDVLCQALRPGGHLIIATFAIGGPTHCSGLDIVQYDAERMLQEMDAELVLDEVAHEVHVTPAGTKQPFQYFRLHRN